MKFLIVDIDKALEDNATHIRAIKANYPNIAQLFHFRKSHAIHIVGPGSNMREYERASNDVYAAFGEPFPFSPEDMARFAALMAASGNFIENQIFGRNVDWREGERLAADATVRIGWRITGPMYGICANSMQRRRELMVQCLDSLNGFMRDCRGESADRTNKFADFALLSEYVPPPRPTSNPNFTGNATSYGADVWVPATHGSPATTPSRMTADPTVTTHTVTVGPAIAIHPTPMEIAAAEHFRANNSPPATERFRANNSPPATERFRANNSPPATERFRENATILPAAERFRMDNPRPLPTERPNFTNAPVVSDRLAELNRFLLTVNFARMNYPDSLRVLNNLLDLSETCAMAISTLHAS